LDRAVPGISGDFVGINYQEASRIATERLVAAGHSRIASVVGTPTFSTTNERMLGLRSALESAGIRHDRNLVLKLEYENDFNRDRIDAVNRTRLTRFLLERKPTALFLAMDGNLSLVRETCDAIGWRIPERLNLVIFDETRPSVARQNDCLWVTCPIEKIGALAANTLMERFAAPDSPRIHRRLPADVWPARTAPAVKDV
jgi:DNA-binding LacI/PurR family transcriptional regulator